MKRLTLLLITIFILTITSFVHAVTLVQPPDGTPIREVNFEGLERLEPAQVRRVMALREGGTFTMEDYRQDLQSIINLGDVDPLELKITWSENEDGSIDLTVHLAENPVVRNITFIGNVKYSEKALETNLDYKEGDILPSDARSRTRRVVEKFYADGGYKSTRVVVEVEEAGPGLVDVVVSVDEGGRIKIDKLIINGNDHFSDLQLKLNVINNGGFLFFSNYYDESAFQDDLSKIQTMYTNAGYLDVQVTRGEFVQDREEGKITPVINVNEGPRYRVDEVLFQGVTYFTEAELAQHFKKVEGRWFKGRRFLNALDKVKDMYGRQGYIDSEFDWSFIKNEDRTIDLLVKVNESPAIYVGEIRVSKNPEYDPEIDISAVERMFDWFVPETKVDTIRKEVRLETGEKYRSTDEVRTRERLRNLGIFRDVDINRIPTADPDVRDVEIVVDEDPEAAFFGVTAGVGDRTGPSVTFELTNRNIGGEADRFRASATIGTRTSIYSVGYFDRYIGDSEISGDYLIYRSRQRFRAYRERTYGASAEFGKPLGEYTSGLVRFRLEHVDFSQYDDDAEEDFEGYPVLAVRPVVVYDRRDNNAWPTRGYKVSGGFETGYADGFLFKILHGYEWYKTLGNSDFIYYYDHNVGLMPYDADNVGISERFFVGGTGSLRGFKYREVGPRDDGDDDLATGGSTRITQRHELRYPFNDFIRGRLFTDAAILEEGFLEFGKPRVGSGVGVIVDFGPFVLELDFAVPVLKDSDDKTQFVHFRLASDF